MCIRDRPCARGEAQEDRERRPRHDRKRTRYGLRVRKRQQDGKNAAGFHRHGRESQVLQKNKTLLPKDTVYLHQARAWSDARTFGSFLRFVRRFTSKPVLPLMDNHSSHANLSDQNGQVTVMECPPNCTSKHQPADQGIIHAWKKRYKTALLSIRVDTMAEARELRRQAKEQK